MIQSGSATLSAETVAGGVTAENVWSDSCVCALVDKETRMS